MFRRCITTSSELYTMNKHKLCLLIYMITKYYITNSKNFKKGQIVKELEKQYVKVRIESLDITSISKYIPSQV